MWCMYISKICVWLHVTFLASSLQSQKQRKKNKHPGMALREFIPQNLGFLITSLAKVQINLICKSSNVPKGRTMSWSRSRWTTLVQIDIFCHKIPRFTRLLETKPAAVTEADERITNKCWMCGDHVYKHVNVLESAAGICTCVSARIQRGAVLRPPVPPHSSASPHVFY